MGADQKQCGNINSNALRQHAWDYFELHANQRISLFRFYTIFLTLFVSGAVFMGIRFPSPRSLEEMGGIFLSIGFVVVTVIFNFLDSRNRQLIHYGEDALRVIELKYFPDISDDDKLKVCELRPDDIKVFVREEMDIRRKYNRVRHSTCFQWFFIAGYIIAVLFLVFSAFSIFYYGCSSSVLFHNIYLRSTY